MTLPSTTGPNPPDDRAPPARQLRRSRGDRVIGGVCGGLGRYFGVDPVLLRIAAVALALATGVGVLAYVIAWIVLPEDGAGAPADRPPTAPGALPWYAGLALVLAVALGVICAAVGAVLLVAALDVWRPSIAWALPLTLVATGVAMLITAGPRPGGGNRRRDAR